MQHYLGPIILGALVAAILIAGCVYVLVRTPKGKGDRRVVGAPLAGGEDTEHERELALENLTTMNQVSILRNNGQFPG
jgi:hypothetical protein